MKNKKLLLISSLLLVIVIISVVFFKQTQNTYGNLLQSKLEGETISDIYIRHYSQNDDKDMKLNNAEDISKLTWDLSDMNLKKTRTSVNRGYHVIFYTEEGSSFTMRFDDSGVVNITGKKTNFQIKGENRLLKSLSSFVDRWNIRN